MDKNKVRVKQETLLGNSAAIENVAQWLRPADPKGKTLKSAGPSASCICQT